ncbi:MAG: SET domain-containing protein [bacterium]|nr:SET domain-containing protein [bacterium]
MKKSFLSPKIVLAQSKIGQGLFASEFIKKGELLVDYRQGPGKFLPTKEANKFFDLGYDYMLQTGEDQFFVATNKNELEDVDFINHSCDPNSGFSGKLRLVAMRSIYPGEEITFDYAMSESSHFEMYCDCGSLNCRRVITGDDWYKEEIRERYKNYFSEYLKRKMMS